ncbi:MAG: glycoside hydrolase family 3 N-terminal domain-containing protein [Candidatus Limnocylindrales bacterium]
MPRPEPTLAQLVGQKLVVAMAGTVPSADLLGRIRRGEVGGVILFGANITSAAEVRALTGALHAAAAEGGQPRLLIYVDQEGGSIKRIAWVPPTLSPPQMGEEGSAAVARAQGAATGAALQALGIDVDLAPVADVPASSDAFMARQSRTFSSSPEWTAILASAFAAGLRSAEVLPVMKHFPGLGLALANTDLNVDTIDAPAAGLAPGLVPYRVAIAEGIPIIMLANATYTALDPNAAAGWSPAISVTLLRHALGFTGVTMTDSLDGTAKARGVAVSGLAMAAAQAGTDLILSTGSEASTRVVYAALLAQARAGTIEPATLEASYRRIFALKQAPLP